MTVNTLFHRTRLPLAKWFLAISYILKPGSSISGRKLAMKLGISKDTACRIILCTQIALHDTAQREMLVAISQLNLAGHDRSTD